MTDHSYAPVLSGDPPSVPVDSTLAKQACRVDGTDEDTLIELYAAAASAHVSAWTGRALVSANWAQDFDAFGRCLRLGVAPVSGIVSVTYRDADDVDQTIDAANYDLVNRGSGLPELRFIDDYDFPTTRDQKPVLTVTFSAGYGDTADDVPAPIRAAILMLVGDLYRNREITVEAAFQMNPTLRMLLDPYRTRWVA